MAGYEIKNCFTNSVLLDCVNPVCLASDIALTGHLSVKLLC